jgi:hypothetical protein
MRVVQQAVRHQVAAIWSLAKKRVEPNARLCAAQERNDRRKTRQKLKVDNGIDAKLSAPNDSLESGDKERRETTRSDCDYVSCWQSFHQIENESVLFKHHKIRIFATDHFDRASYRGISQNR